MGWRRVLLVFLGLVLIVTGVADNDPMRLIFSMWIFVYLLRDNLVNYFNRFSLPVAFVGAGVIFGLITEILAIIANSSVQPEQRILISPDPVLDIIYGFFFYFLLMATWYLLLKKIHYSKKEVFLLTGILGLYGEELGQVLIRVFTVPWVGLFYAIIIVFVYGIFPMLAYLLTEHRFKAQQRNVFFRWFVACLALFLQWALYGLYLLPFLKSIIN